MIWAILALLGVPLWLCAVGILVMVLRNRGLRKRYGDIPVRVLRPGKKRWTRGHALWVANVFAWRGSPAAWNEDLIHVAAATIRDAEPEELKHLRRIGDAAAVAVLRTIDGDHLRVATDSEHRSALSGPFKATARQT